jgi:hypothetical protein
MGAWGADKFLINFRHLSLRIRVADEESEEEVGTSKPTIPTAGVVPKRRFDGEDEEDEVAVRRCRTNRNLGYTLIMTIDGFRMIGMPHLMMRKIALHLLPPPSLARRGQ